MSPKKTASEHYENKAKKKSKRSLEDGDHSDSEHEKKTKEKKIKRIPEASKIPKTRTLDVGDNPATVKDLKDSDQSKERRGPEESSKQSPAEPSTDSDDGLPKFNYAADFPKMYYPVVHTNNTHNKRQRCPFCSVPQSNFVPHITVQHKEEPEVVEINKLPPKDKRRADLISLLRLKGNHIQNLLVKKEKEGMFHPERRVPGTMYSGPKSGVF